MPIYEYLCNSCGVKKEHLQKMSDAPLKVCPACGSENYVKLVSAAGFQLKGSGWYVTDFKNKPVPETAKQSDKNGATDATNDSKNESKSGSKTDSGTAVTSSGSNPSESGRSSAAAKSGASAASAD